MSSFTAPDGTPLCGAYGAPYDPRPAIERAGEVPDEESAWMELWDELHHQGDLGLASYAALPLLVDRFRERPRTTDVYAIALCIEVERHRAGNPALADWLADAYQAALRELRGMALEELDADAETSLYALALIAAASGHIEVAALIPDLHEEPDWLAEHLEAWRAQHPRVSSG